VDEDAERPSEHPLDQVDRTHAEPYPDDIPRIAQHERPASQSRRCACKLDAVGRAADHAIEHHHVAWVNRVRLLEDVRDDECCALLEAPLTRQLRSEGLVGVYELCHLAGRGAGFEQLHLQLPDPASDLEDARARQASFRCALDHPSLETVETPPPIAREVLASDALREHLLAGPAAAAARHRPTLVQVRTVSRDRARRS
jgi:hypothetical protein